MVFSIMGSGKSRVESSSFTIFIESTNGFEYSDIEKISILMNWLAIGQLCCQAFFSHNSIKIQIENDFFFYI